MRLGSMGMGGLLWTHQRYREGRLSHALANMGSQVNSSRPLLTRRTAQPPSHTALTCADGDGSQVKGPQPLSNLLKHRRHARVPTKPKAPAGGGRGWSRRLAT